MATQEPKRLVVLRKGDDATVYQVESEANGIAQLTYKNGAGRAKTEIYCSMLMKPTKAQLKNYQKE